jgi:peptidoglycan-associated lipoprotein
MTVWEPSFSMLLNRMFRHGIGCRFWLLLAFSALFLALLTACSGKTPVAETPTPPPLPPAPTATITVAPAAVHPGEAAVVTWKTENATDVNIAPIGAVQASGSTAVNPSESTTYHLTAKGPGGVQESDARITVTAPAAQAPASSAEEGSLPDASNQLDIFFDTDEYSIRPDQNAVVQSDALFLKAHPDVRIVVEGHCDEMGSTDYNLGLGDKRAAQVKSALEKAGVSPNRMRTISYGKERPFCEEESEYCWKRNRRAHITYDVQR